MAVCLSRIGQLPFSRFSNGLRCSAFGSFSFSVVRPATSFNYRLSVIRKIDHHECYGILPFYSSSIMTVPRNEHFPSRLYSAVPKKDDEESRLKGGNGAHVLASGTETKETLFQRFKAMAKKYWYILIPVHIVTTGFWLAGFYVLAKSGLDVEGILERLGAPEVLMKPVRNSNAGYYAVVYACYKLVTPLRYVVTIGGTTVVVRYLTRFGYIKPMPNKQELLRMYEVGKDNFTKRQQAWRRRLKDLNWRLRVKENLKGKRSSRS